MPCKLGNKKVTYYKIYCIMSPLCTAFLFAVQLCVIMLGVYASLCSLCVNVFTPISFIPAFHSASQLQWSMVSFKYLYV